MIKYIDNGILCGWYFCNRGEFYGDGTKVEAIRVQTVFKDTGDAIKTFKGFINSGNLIFSKEA